MNNNDNTFLFNDISSIKGVGKKLKKFLRNKKIEKIKDMVLDLPYDIIDRSKISGIKELEIGKITTIKVKVYKYNFPRIRNLPNKVICENNKDKINIIFFNSYEGYIRKVLPLNTEVLISGKIGYYKKNYQITNPTYIKPINEINEIAKIFPKYSLTEGLTEKMYRKLISKVISKIDDKDEWYTKDFLTKNNFFNFKKTIINLHNPKNKINIKSKDYERLAYDEILANYLTLSSVRKNIKSIKKNKNIENKKISKIVLKNFSHNLTSGQKEILKEIKYDLSSEKRMFRLLQGDVGSGKTIIGMLAAADILESKYQVAVMAPTEILATQHYELAIKLFNTTEINIEILTSKTHLLKKKQIVNDLRLGKINLIFGTHALFQQKIKFFNLGFVIIDEQHKFGVRQRIKLAKKGGKNCDLLLMSATPIPRSMMLSIFGDMDISRLKEKPKYRKEINTLIKPESKISEILPLLKKQISLNNQVFWICPLIEDSDKIKFSSVKKKYNYLKDLFPNEVGLVHGNLEKNDRKKILYDFETKKIKILVSTTVIEVGVDYPNANIIVIEDANKFGLSQLHQLRGRVGRGDQKSICILLYKKNLTQRAKKRLKILKSTNDGFLIAEEDLKLRGFGDILGYQQSGIKNFKFADPIHHEKLFKLAEKNIKKINIDNINRFETLLKLHDRADIINEI